MPNATRYSKCIGGEGFHNPAKQMTTATYLSTFFAEKDLDERTYEATAPDGTLHLIPTGCVIEAILRAPAGEQAQVAGVLRQIDFKNGNVHHFLNHLAGALAARY